MLRVAAAAGLRPWEVYAMTQRELEVFLQGQEEFWARVRETLAWVTANLMNVQRSKKTPAIKPEKLLPKADLKRREKTRGAAKEAPVNLLGMDPKQAAAVFTQRRLERAEEAWRASPEGQRLEAFMHSLGYGEPPTDAEADGD